MKTLDNRKKQSSISFKLIEEGYTKIWGQLFVCRDCKMYFKEENIYVIISQPMQEGKEDACETCKLKKSMVKVQI